MERRLERAKKFNKFTQKNLCSRYASMNTKTQKTLRQSTKNNESKLATWNLFYKYW